MKLHLIKNKEGFYPADQDSLDKANKVSESDTLMNEILNFMG